MARKSLRNGIWISRSAGKFRTLAGLLLLAAVSQACADSGDALHFINDPAGGHVVYGIFNSESTMQGAMVSMLRKIHTNFGVRPEIGQFFQSRDGHTVGTFFKLTARSEGAKQISGMVMVTMPSGLKPAAAVLYDDADRFNTTEPQLMKKLTAAFSGTGNSTNSPLPSNPDSPSNPPARHGEDAIPPLHQSVVPDNSASIDLPAGWHITGGGGGSLHAEGPRGESVHMGVINQNIYDPNNPKARGMIQYMSRGTVPFTVCPFTNDLVAMYQCVARQNRQRMHLTPIASMKVINATNMPPNRYEQIVTKVSAEIDFGDEKGPMTCSIRLGTMHQAGSGTFTLDVTQACVPKNLAEEEWPTITAMAASYRQNGQVVFAQGQEAVARIQEQGRATQARIDAHNQEVDQQKKDFEAHSDNLDRDSKSRQNYNLGQSVLQDNEDPARGTVSNPTADAFVKANPDRYQIVPQKDWIRGQDY